MKTTIKFFLLVILLSFFQVPTSNATVHIPASKENVITDSSEKKLNKKEKRAKDKERRKLKRRMWFLGIGLGLCALAGFYIFLSLFSSISGFFTIFTVGFYAIIGLLIAASTLLIYFMDKTKKELDSSNPKKEVKVKIEEDIATKKKKRKRAGIILGILGALFIGLGFAF